MSTEIPEVLFLIAPNWKQPSHPSKGKWTNKAVEHLHSTLLSND